MLPRRVQRYLDAVVATCAEHGRPLASLVLFGSAAKGGFSEHASDVDLLVVVADGTSRDECRRLRDTVKQLEVAHGFRAPADPSKPALARFAEEIGGNALSCFVCTRPDLLSGDVARILDLNAVQAAFVDRIVLATIIASAVTVWGEDLLPRVTVPPVRRVDVLKAYHAFANQLLLCAWAYALLPDATRYAMGAMKRSLHSCYFVYGERTAPLETEVAFFAARLGERRTFAELLALRAHYRPSLGFVLGAFATLTRMHLRTARENRFSLGTRRP